MIKMLKINFDENYGAKLNGFVFSTIRKQTPKHEKEYIENEGKIVQITLRRKPFCKAELLAVIPLDKLEYVHPKRMELDTGMEYGDAMKLFEKFGIKKDDAVFVLLFQREVKKND